MASLAQRATPGVAVAALAAAISLCGSPAFADPPGNNGTVKIAAVGDLDRIPNNTPHPGCTFTVQWYGYDKGPDIVSHVTFSSQAPTGDVTLGVTGPSTVFVGGDDASGAGTPTGLDGTATYTLAFTGGAPAKQGYHVRLVVATPHSLGNDTKSKVFWVGPCAPPTPPSTPPSTPPPAPPASGPGTTHSAAGTVIVPLSHASHPKVKHVKAPSVVTSGETASSWSAARWEAAGLAGLGATLVGLGALVWRRRGV